MSSTCTSTISEYFSLGLNGTFHVLILFTFLTVLYFSIIAPLETGAFESEIKGQVGNAVTAMAASMAPQDRGYVSEIINMDMGGGKTMIDAGISHYSKPSEVIVENNKWVRLTAIEVISVLVICVLLVVLVLSYSCGKCTGIFGIIKENIITFAFIGIVEYMFFTRIAFKYVPAPPSTMVTTLIETFKKTFV